MLSVEVKLGKAERRLHSSLVFVPRHPHLQTDHVTADDVYGGQLGLATDVVAVVLAEAEDALHGVVPGAEDAALTDVLLLEVVLPAAGEAALLLQLQVEAVEAAARGCYGLPDLRSLIINLQSAILLLKTDPAAAKIGERD